MSTAVSRATGTPFIPRPPYSMTSTITGACNSYARRHVFPFPREIALAPVQPLATNEPTSSATERDRFHTPAGLLFDAAQQAARIAAEAPTEQLVPTAATMREAIALLRMLPAEIEMPEPVVEPAGAISWLWDRGARGFLVLAVDGMSRVQRSAVIAGEETWGTRPMSDGLAAEELALLGHFRVPHA